MYTKDSGTNQSPERRNESDSNSSTCPECNGPLSGIDTRGRGRHTVEPCGCTVSDAHLKPRVATDGGQTCDDTERSNQYQARKMIGQYVSSIDDVNDLTRTVNRELNDIRSEGGGDVRVLIATPDRDVDTDTDDEEIVTDGGVSYTDLTGFQRDLLWSILDLQSDPATERTYGLALKDYLEQRYEGEIFHGRLYPNLDELVEYGLVEKQELDRRTNEYRLTGAGRALLEDIAGRRDRVLDQAANLARADGGSDE